MLDNNAAETGVIVYEALRSEKLDYVFAPYGNLSTAVTLKSDGNVAFRVVGCIAETVKSELKYTDQWARAIELFTAPSLQIASFTITEKGYNIRSIDGNFTDVVQAEMLDPEMKTATSMGIVCRLLYERYKAGRLPLALLSMDNCSHNGSHLRSAILDYAKAWTDAGFMDAGFYDYVSDESIVAFPWSMIDKITPAADPSVGKILNDHGYTATVGAELNGRRLPPSFANAEETEYLVIEENFPNGRPAWEKVGVIFTDRETVDRVETMKVTTCLNPLHTALAVYGCLLGYNRISEEMKDEDLVNLINGVGYTEGLPVVVHPGIMEPKEFIDTVINVRFTNPFLPDTPQRIATDTSQKIRVRFGRTLQAYQEEKPEDLPQLKFIPAVLSGWLRYLVGIDDTGNTFEQSADPMLATLKETLADIRFGEAQSIEPIVKELLTQKEIFGVDLYEVGLAEKVISGFEEMLQGPGAVRAFLKSL